METNYFLDSSLAAGYKMYAIPQDLNPVASYFGYDTKVLIFTADDASFAHDLFAYVAVSKTVEQLGDCFNILIEASLDAKYRMDRSWQTPNSFQPI